MLDQRAGVNNIAFDTVYGGLECFYRRALGKYEWTPKLPPKLPSFADKEHTRKAQEKPGRRSRHGCLD